MKEEEQLKEMITFNGAIPCVDRYWVSFDTIRSLLYVLNRGIPCVDSHTKET
jgi:hypothetical protein